MGETGANEDSGQQARAWHSSTGTKEALLECNPASLLTMDMRGCGGADVESLLHLRHHAPFDRTMRPHLYVKLPTKPGMLPAALPAALMPVPAPSPPVFRSTRLMVRSTWNQGVGVGT